MIELPVTITCHLQQAGQIDVCEELCFGDSGLWPYDLVNSARGEPRQSVKDSA